jgi:hypothetical protein
MGYHSAAWHLEAPDSLANDYARRGKNAMERIPLNDKVALAIARLVDDAQEERREPSHSDIEFQINQAGLSAADPKTTLGHPVGKEKRVRAVLAWAVDNNLDAGERFAYGIIGAVAASGGFRERISNLSAMLKLLGVSLALDGSLAPTALEGLSGGSLTEALAIYVARAKRSIEDAALLTGTSKDLMEAVAVHVVEQVWGKYDHSASFAMLLGLAFTALGLATPADAPCAGEHPRADLERKMYDLACAINKLRNKQGTGHGRPWVPDVSDEEARASVEFIGVICERLLTELNKKVPGCCKQGNHTT